MALITALPNFFGTTAPASADFNQAARAIVAQLGGTCPGGSNQFLFSEQVDNSAWTKSHLSVSADSVVSPIATLTADLVVEDAVASVQHFFTPATSPVNFGVKLYGETVVSFHVGGADGADEVGTSL